MLNGKEKYLQSTDRDLDDDDDDEKYTYLKKKCK